MTFPLVWEEMIVLSLFISQHFSIFHCTQQTQLSLFYNILLGNKNYFCFPLKDLSTYWDAQKLM